MMISNNKSGLYRINDNLVKYIKKIQETEDCSFSHASKILSKILDDAGGLKDY